MGEYGVIFDFGRGEFVTEGDKIIAKKGKEKLKNEIEKLLRTEYAVYSIYHSYGIPYTIFSKRDKDYIRLSLTSILNDKIPALIDGVLSVSDIDVTFRGRTVTVNFTVNSEQEKVSIEL